MTKQDVIDHFGSVSAIAEALGITVQSVYEWPDNSIPRGRQFEIQAITNGDLKVDPKLLNKSAAA